MYIRKIRDVESYRQRLGLILGDSLLLFNPHSISDERLMSGLEKMRWRGASSLTQAVILTFTGVRNEGCGLTAREWVTYRVGDSEEEVSESMVSLTCRRTACDSLRQVRHTINGYPVRDARQIRALTRRRAFVSRNIITSTGRGFGKAMSMHRLKGELAEDAATVRVAMLAAKQEMLGRLLEYPSCSIYLDGIPSAQVDIVTPIRTLLDRISQYPGF